MKEHVFAICAYKDSPYLGACIRSLKRQTIPSDIIICTSTPSGYIEELARRYNLPMYVRDGESNMADDWNFAYGMADARFVTIVHQDDIYHRDYTKYFFKALKRYPDMTLFCTDCLLIRNGKAAGAGISGLIKRVLRLPLRIRPLADKKTVKRSVLMFGNPIICPSCTYNKKKLKGPLFVSSYSFALDWDNLLRIAALPGRFVCEEKPLIAYRMHKNSETVKQMESEGRFSEEEKMFEKIWPEGMARFLMKFYRFAAKAYH